MTRIEQQILNYVRSCNDQGALAGVSVKEFRFAKRLAATGEIVYVNWRRDLGAGWAIAGHEISERRLP
ncbi:hypothetical protein WMF38_57565 [Sorangium sp. So ce118]